MPCGGSAERSGDFGMKRIFRARFRARFRANPHKGRATELSPRAGGRLRVPLEFGRGPVHVLPIPRMGAVIFVLHASYASRLQTGFPAGFPTLPVLFLGLCFCGGVSVDRNLPVPRDGHTTAS